MFNATLSLIFKTGYFFQRMNSKWRAEVALFLKHQVNERLNKNLFNFQAPHVCNDGFFETFASSY